MLLEAPSLKEMSSIRMQAFMIKHISSYVSVILTVLKDIFYHFKKKTGQMPPTLLAQIKALKAKAKVLGNSNLKFKVASGNVSSLNQVIKTKEEADIFMKFLRAL